jgi:hypothetical protein
MANYSSELESPAHADVVTFDTWGAFLKQAEVQGEGCPPGQSLASRDEYEHYDSWSGTRNFAEAVKLARDGWKEGEEKVRALSRRIEARLIHRIVREDVNYDVEGMMFDVARYLEGEPEHWTRMEESTMQADAYRHVKIMVSMSASCGVRAETIIARGAAIAALIELLEYADHRVELWICDTLSSHKDGGVSGGAIHQRYIRVKAYDQPLEPARVAFALAHPSTFRRLDFSLIEQSKVATRLGSGYGVPVDAPKSVREEASLYLGRMQGWQHAEWSSPEYAEAWVLAELAKQGVVLRDED